MVENSNVIIIGGGLVGSLAACFMGKRGFNVDLYESRKDLRINDKNEGKSINLAISHRGRMALKSIGLEDDVLENAIPMYGRMTHSIDGKIKSIPYDPINNQCIYSVGRNYLNKLLITAAAKYQNVKLNFEHKLTSADPKLNEITVLNLKNNETKNLNADLILGADGAHSTLRHCLQQTPLFEFKQSYIKHGYIELFIANNKFMKKNYLHIWPRNDLMMIALPNFDQTWTVTLFMSFEQFEQIENSQILFEFFKKTFPDALELIGGENLKKMYFSKKPSPLITIKCKPYYFGLNYLLIGDAAHAMVPFYGQGMNAGFEDCQLLDALFDDAITSTTIMKDVIRKFSDKRVQDGHVICDLALYNYIEMRLLINYKSFYLRKFFDTIIFKYLKNQWLPLYHSVTFTNLNYYKCMENHQKQNKV